MNPISNAIFRIVFESRETYRVMAADQSLWPAEISGKLRAESKLWPAVGDWVEGVPQPGHWVLITQVRPRHSTLARRDPSGHGTQILAANVDILFIVTSANEDLNLNRLDRYVALARGGGVQPVILINKIELAEDPHAVLDDVAARFPDTDIHGVSAHEGWNLEALHTYAEPDRTLVFAGSSGVGKSSLINQVLGEQKMTTQEIRESDSRGRHTTTHRELHLTPSGAVLIDTPGIRQVGLTDEADLGSAFEDIEALAATCRFGDCRHESEPGCAVRSALDSGQLARDRWENFLKLERELAFERRKKDKALQSAEKKKWAKIHKALKKRI